MSTLISWATSLGAWNWLILALLLLAMEMAVPGVYFLWFGVAALIVGLLTFATGVGWQLQLILFAGLAVATALLVRRYARAQDSPSDSPNLNERSSQYIGRVVTVEDAIAAGRGKVRIGDTLWSAEGPDAPAGARVRIIGANGSVMVIAREDN